MKLAGSDSARTARSLCSNCMTRSYESGSRAFLQLSERACQSVPRKPTCLKLLLGIQRLTRQIDSR
eukprot:596315-Amphidinium_carterae.1